MQEYKTLCADLRHQYATVPLVMDAVAAIHTLTDELKNCRDELCLKCGNYREAHRGACDGCRYKEM